MTNKETVPRIIERQSSGTERRPLISFEYLVLLLIFRDSCLYVSLRRTESRKGGGEGNFRWLSRDSPPSREVSEFSGKTDGGDEQLV